MKAVGKCGCIKMNHSSFLSIKTIDLSERCVGFPFPEWKPSSYIGERGEGEEWERERGKKENEKEKEKTVQEKEQYKD